MRIVLAVTLGLAAFAAVLASANTIGGVRPERIGAGADLVAACDTDGVSLDFEPQLDGADHVVPSVSVSGLAEGCAGAELTVSLSDGTGTVVRTGTRTVDGTDGLAVVLDSPIGASQLERAAVVVQGGDG